MARFISPLGPKREALWSELEFIDRGVAENQRESEIHFSGE